MKLKVFTFLMGLISIFSVVEASVLIVNNSPNSPGQYSQIDPAVAAANAGDTIYVQGSAAI